MWYIITNSEIISSFLNLLQESKQTYNFAYENQKKEEDKTQDILHKIELDNLNYKERAKLATQLAENRKERRRYKDIAEETYDLYCFAENNKKFINNLTQLLGQVRKVEKYHKDRHYVPKVIK